MFKVLSAAAAAAARKSTYPSSDQKTIYDSSFPKEKQRERAGRTSTLPRGTDATGKRRRRALRLPRIGGAGTLRLRRHASVQAASCSPDRDTFRSRWARRAKRGRAGEHACSLSLSECLCLVVLVRGRRYPLQGQATTMSFPRSEHRVPYDGPL